MPKIRKLEEPLAPLLEEEPQPARGDHGEAMPEMKSPVNQTERKMIFESPRKGIEAEQSLDVLKLIEDLHAQLLSSGQTKRALEMDLTSYQKTIHQLSQDNQELRRQLEGLRKELQRLKELQSESIYLQEENADALERIKEVQQELREAKETLAKATREREEAWNEFMSWNPRSNRGRSLKSRER